MPIPLLAYAPKTQNSRVTGYDVPSDAQPRIYSTDNLLSASDMGALIEAAYRQIFFHAFNSDREPALESQLRNGQITVRQFVRGLMLSNTFTRSFYDLNNNYRFVEHCINKALGRDVYSEEEKIAWSIVIATKGRAGFIDALLNTSEYLDNFGEAIVPFHRRRVLASGTSEIPFNIKNPRYEDYYRGKFGFPQIIWQSQVRKFRSQDQQPKVGDPALFLGMAQSINPTVASPSRVSAMNIDFLNGVPYRKIST